MVLKLMVDEINRRFEALHSNAPEIRFVKFGFIRTKLTLDELQTKFAEIAADTNLSPQGRVRAQQDVAAEKLISLRIDERELNTATRGIEERRKALYSGMQADPQDVVGAIRREGIRTWLRSMAPGEALAVISGSKDPKVLQTALESPEMIGLPAEAVADLGRRLAEEHNGAEVRELDTQAEMVELTLQAVNMAKAAIAAAIDPKGGPVSPAMLKAGDFGAEGQLRAWLTAADPIATEELSKVA